MFLLTIASLNKAFVDARLSAVSTENRCLLGCLLGCLRGAYLPSTCLHGAYLPSTYLHGAYLRRAHMHNAYLAEGDSE